MDDPSTRPESPLSPPGAQPETTRAPTAVRPTAVAKRLILTIPPVQVYAPDPGYDPAQARMGKP